MLLVKTFSERSVADILTSKQKQIIVETSKDWKSLIEGYRDNHPLQPGTHPGNWSASNEQGSVALSFVH
jgi:hypothetical protein